MDMDQGSYENHQNDQSENVGSSAKKTSQKMLFEKKKDGMKSSVNAILKKNKSMSRQQLFEQGLNEKFGKKFSDQIDRNSHSLMNEVDNPLYRVKNKRSNTLFEE